MDFSKKLLPAKRESIFRRDSDDYVWCGSAVRADDGMYYLFYSYWPRETGFNGWVTHSRIGCARSESSTGPFRHVCDALPPAGSGWDRDCTHNPTVTQTPDGRFLMVYKAVNDKGEMPRGGAVLCGAAFADSPLGPFTRHPAPIFVNPRRLESSSPISVMNHKETGQEPFGSCPIVYLINSENQIRN